MIEKIFLDGLRASLAKESFDAKLSDEEWSKLFALANSQFLLPILFEAAYEGGVKELPIYAELRKRAVAAVVRQTSRTVDFRRLYELLLSKGLHPIIVKGQLCSRLYPMPDHRVSSDDDIYVAAEEISACRAALAEYGLKCELSENETADEYTYKNEQLYVELHASLFDSDDFAGGDFNRFFRDIHKNAVEIDGLLSMPPHEHLLYLILHSFKHFLYCGVGVRQTCDIALWAREYHDLIDWQLLFAQLSSLHGEKFAAAQFIIAERYLGFELDLPPIWTKCTVDPEPMLSDMFDGGVYGSETLTRLHTSTAVLSAVKADRTGKKQGIVKSLFPKYEYIAGKYGYVKKHPFLLPIGWANRMLDYVGELKKSDSSAADSLKLASERIELLRCYGVIK